MNDGERIVQEKYEREGWTVTRSGLPDLLAFKETAEGFFVGRFIEVKDNRTGDQLSEKQRTTLRQLNRLLVPAEVLVARVFGPETIVETKEYENTEAIDRATQKLVARTIQQVEAKIFGAMDEGECEDSVLKGISDEDLVDYITQAVMTRLRRSEGTKASIERRRAQGIRVGPAVQIDYAKAKALRAAGKSFPVIARELGISVGGAFKAVNNLADEDAPPLAKVA